MIIGFKNIVCYNALKYNFYLIQGACFVKKMPKTAKNGVFEIFFEKKCLKNLPV